MNQYKVNVLNKKGKEIWKHTSSLEIAIKVRDKAREQGLESHIYIMFYKFKWQPYTI